MVPIIVGFMPALTLTGDNIYTSPTECINVLSPIFRFIR